MKKQITLILYLLLVGVNSGLVAQQLIDVQAKADAISSLYQLNEQQQKKAVKIQERRHRNMEEIQILADQDPELYLRKRAALVKGTEASVRRMLTKEQLKLYRDRQVEYRKERARMKKEMSATGAPPSEIQLALLEYYDQQF